ncbi:CotH kinase family protein [Mucilaginibacter gynuensis]|uniref:CotH kinase family protein n=1 Tax=Mucilaginibacter gynuensis TaxID=1302236 RepID=A0ABP8HIH1_9SPHI
MLNFNRLALYAIFPVLLLASCSKKTTEVDPDPVVPEPPKENIVKTLDSFVFKTTKNFLIQQAITGNIVGDTVFVNTFAGTDLSVLIPEFTFKGGVITVNNKVQVSGVTANDYSKKVQYTITAKDSTKKTYTIKFTDTGLPAIYISTNGVPIDSKEVYVAGNIKIAGDIAGTILYEGKTTIKGRGNSTWNMPKKPYRIKLDKKAGLLGMAESKNWVLLANYADKTLMRNELAFELSRHSGLAFTPNSRYVEVFVNGLYAGNYQLTEQIKEGKTLVNIEEQADGTTSMPDISGGYLVELDGFADGEPVHFYTGRSMPITVKYPDEDVINQQQKYYISNHFQKFEDALFADNFTDPVNGYRKYFDVDSYVNYYLVNEVMGNSDIFWSTYMYKKRNDDKIYTGPVWDFDIAANNDDRLGDAVNKLMFNAGHDTHTWIDRLMQDPAFRQKIRSRWNELKMQTNTLPNTVDALAKKLAVSQSRNFIKWDILSLKVYREFQVAGTYDKEVQYLKTYLTNRINWLDTKFNSSEYQ